MHHKKLHICIVEKLPIYLYVVLLVVKNIDEN